MKKRFGAIEALRGVSLQLFPGECLALFGGNGSGKSTLVKILAGSVRADAGSIVVSGQPLLKPSPQEAMRLGIGATYQEMSLLDNLTVGENLVLHHLPTRWGAFTDYHTVEETAGPVLRKFHLEHLLHRPAGYLSLGEKHLVELAKVLIRKPKILILDEITAALRRSEVDLVAQVIAEAKEAGCGIIFVSHQLDEVYRLCDRVVVMVQGQVVADRLLATMDERELMELSSGRSVNPALFRNGKGSVPEHAVAAPEPGEDAGASEESPRLSVRNMVLAEFGAPVTFDLRAGEIVGIAGLQGQGQSVLVRQLFGAAGDAPVTLSIDGREVTIRTPEDAVREGMAFISGNREAEGVFLQRSVKENLLSVATSHYPRPELHQARTSVNHLVDKLGVVVGHLLQPVRTLSGGNQQKTVIGRWLFKQPKILLADDPTRGIDVLARREVHGILRELARQGSAVLMTSSQDSELAEVADRVLVMYRGRITQELRGPDLSAHDITEASLAASGSQGGKDQGESPEAKGSAPEPRFGSRSGLLKRLVAWPGFFVAVLTLVLFTATAIMQPTFLTPFALSSLMAAYVPLMGAALGQTAVLLVGGIDLSVGAIISLVNVLTTLLVGAGWDFLEVGPADGLYVCLFGGGCAAGWSFPVSALAAVFMGTLIGVLNGFVVSVLRIRPLVATLATSFIVSGLALYLMPRPGGLIPVEVVTWYQGSFLFLPIPVWFALAFLLLLGGLLRTPLGVALRATGGNPWKAFVSGVPVQRAQFAAYTLCGFLTGVGAVALTMNTASGDPNVGVSFTLNAIAAAVLGGVSLAGGRGEAVGPLFGTLFLAMVVNLVLSSNVPFWYQQLISGLVIVVGLAVMRGLRRGG